MVREAGTWYNENMVVSPLLRSLGGREKSLDSDEGWEARGIKVPAEVLVQSVCLRRYFKTLLHHGTSEILLY